MTRHRGTFKPEMTEPYEISRSRVENFIKCPACFWMDRVKGIKLPETPQFLLNSATDRLLKKDFDKYRKIQKPHPLMIRHGLGHLVPYGHEDFEKWTQSTQLGLRTTFEPANFIFGGGLDDVWHDPVKDELFVVDYKSTAGGKSEDETKLKPISLDGPWKGGLKRQMDMYQWILRQNGFKVNPTGYFLYVNGDQHFQNGMLVEDLDMAMMNFDVQLISYDADDSWVPDTLMQIKACLHQAECPEHADTGFGAREDEPCHNNRLLQGAKDNGLI